MARVQAAGTWLELAEATSHLLQCEAVAGERSHQQVFKLAADARGVSTDSITKPWRALSYLRARFPEALANAEVACGFMTALELEKLEKLDEELAATLVDDVLSGRMSLSALKAARKDAEDRRRAEQGAPVSGRLGRRKVAETERWLADCVGKNIHVFSNKATGRILHPDRNALVVPDLLAEAECGKTLAFEFKVGETAFTRANLVNVLARMSLYDRFGYEPWIVVPAVHREALIDLEAMLDSIPFPCGLGFVEESGETRVLQRPVA